METFECGGHVYDQTIVEGAIILPSPRFTGHSSHSRASTAPQTDSRRSPAFIDLGSLNVSKKSSRRQVNV